MGNEKVDSLAIDIARMVENSVIRQETLNTLNEANECIEELLQQLKKTDEAYESLKRKYETLRIKYEQNPKEA